MADILLLSAFLPAVPLRLRVSALPTVALAKVGGEKVEACLRTLNDALSYEKLTLTSQTVFGIAFHKASLVSLVYCIAFLPIAVISK